MGTLRNKTFIAIGWDLFGNYGGQLTAFVISIFLARLLTPEDFGIVGMSIAFIFVLDIFKDFGFSYALIQNKKNTSLTYSTVFYFNIFAGIFLTGLLYFTAPLIGKFYDTNNSDVIVLIVRLLSISFFVDSFNLVQSTILSRSLDFKKLAIRDLVSQLIGGIAAILLACYGFGLYALVVQRILSTIIKTILLWNLTSWYPKAEFSFMEIKKLFGFSIYVFGGATMNKIIQQADTLMIGKLFSPTSLGFFTRAKSLNEVINRTSFATIEKVFFPVLSSIQDEDERFKKIFLKVINLVTVISVFLTGVFYLIGEELIIGLFGRKWEPSVQIFKILILQGFTLPLSGIIVSAFLAKGKSKQNFHYGNIRKILQLLPFVIVLIYGFLAFIYALLAVSIIAWLLNIYFTDRSLDIPFMTQLKIVMPVLFAAACFIILIEILFPDGFSYLWATGKVITFICLYLIFLYLTKSDVLNELNYYKKKISIKLRKK